MSWNPAPLLSGANWQGNTQLATKNQLISSVQGIYTDLQDLSGFDFQNLEVSTLKVHNWLSAPTIYVSSLYAQTIDLSGITLDPSGVFIVNDLSGTIAQFNTTLLSSLQFKFDPTVNITINVGDATFGFLSGLGFLIFETLLGIGAGAGAAFQGIGNGIAAMIMAKGSQNTYINNNNFELIGGSTQLQISTLGNAYPLYSSIMRYVSSVAPNQIPGEPVFTSTLFYPGQLCIRSISDPYPVVSQDAAYIGSTLQQFGEWVPLTGVEPEDIIANSVTTNTLAANFISSGSAAITDFVSIYGGIQNLTTETLTIPDGNDGGKINMGYSAPLNFALGSLGNATIQGNINYMFLQSDQDIVFTKTGDPSLIPFNASLSMGSNANESILKISTIQNTSLFSENAYITNLTVTNFSTINSNSAVNVLSTNIVEADIIYANFANISSLAPFKFVSSPLGNPFSVFDITRTDSVVSTTYNQISSLTQNILSYSLNAAVQNEAVFNIGDPGGVGYVYEVTPANISQWASTQIVFNGYQAPGGIDLGWVAQWGVSPGDLQGAAPGGATFDVLYAPSPVNNANAPFYLTEQSNRSYPAGVSTFYQQPNPNPPVPITFSARMTLPPIVGGSRSGWWQMTTPAPPPYTTSNNNTLQMYQDINDSYIQGTDRLHIVAGDILLDGKVSFSNFVANEIDATTVNSVFLNTFSTATINNISSSSAFISTIYTDQVYANSRRGGLDASFYKSTSYVSAPTVVYPFNATFQTTSPDFIPEYNLLSKIYGNNYFTSFNFSSWSNTVWINTVGVASGPPAVILDDLNTPLGPYAGSFWINNQVGQVIPIIQIFPTVGYSTIGFCAGNTIMKLTTANSGSNWTLQSNVANPQGITPGVFNNTFSVTQYQTNTQVVDSQTLDIQAPNTSITTGNLNLFADQIRVQSHRYGSLPQTGLPSYPIGIEFGMYQDPNMVFTFQGDFFWNSDATNVFYNVTNQIFYDVNAWNCMVIPNRFRTDTYALYEFDVEPVVIPVGGGGYCWGYSRYILVNGAGNGPDGASSYVGYIMIPKNYCTFV